MHLKQFYNIATKVSSRKNATTFGDLLDWSDSIKKTSSAVFKIPAGSRAEIVKNEVGPARVQSKFLRLSDKISRKSF